MDRSERALRRLRDAYGAGVLSTATLEDRAGLVMHGEIEDAIWDLPRWRPLLRDRPRRIVLGDREWSLEITGRWTLGRDDRCEIAIGGDDAVSRRHAQLAVRAGLCLVRDLQSTNGTLLNGRPVRRARLRSGDLLELGETLLQLR